MKIAIVSSECVPYAKTGGLGDVIGSLPKALEKLGCDVKVFIPKYLFIDELKHGLRYNWDVGEMPIRVNGIVRSVHLHQAKLPNSNVEVNFIDCPHFYNRGRIYTNDWDEDERFILLCKGVIETCQRLSWAPDVIQCNDWQTGLIPLYIKDNYNWDRMFDKTATIFTIHNIGYQGRFGKDTLFKAEINPNFYYPEGPVEFENSVSFMKTGIVFSDLISTVSLKYSHEILKPEFGAGLDPVLKARKPDVYGILNGVDYEEWNPETDKFLPYKYSIKDLSVKKANKKFLMEHFKLPFDENRPLIGMISRLVPQKGFDIFVEAVDDLMKLDAQWIMLGSGEYRYEEFFWRLSQHYPGKFASYIGYNNELAHLIEAGADIFVMPSRYEPCGLNQIYSLKYGTVPVVRKTGGLADTVKDWDEENYWGFDHGNGFSFYDYSGYALFKSVERAVNTFANKDVWRKIQINGMKCDFSWEKSAEKYIELYKIAKEKRAG
jgi:starch synthase